MVIIVTPEQLSIQFEAGDASEIVGSLWHTLSVEGFPSIYYHLTFQNEKVDDNCPLADFGGNANFQLRLNPDIEPLWLDFWGASKEVLGDLSPDHPERLKFEQNLMSNKLELLTIVKHASNQGNFDSATIANDYYKLTMAPVLAAAQQQVDGNVVVAFALSLRTPGLAELLAKNENGILDNVVNALNSLQYRIFDHKIILKSVENKPVKAFWVHNIESICGPADDPNTLIRPRRVGSDADFYDGTVIYNRQVFPKEVTDGQVVISVYFKNGKLHIEATGPWNRCTFLETSMMQVVYQVLLEHHRRFRRITFGRWLHEALLREHLSIEFAMTKCPQMKGALFAGRRTGHHIFTLLQTWYASRFYPNSIGTSSFDAWHTLTHVLGMPKIVPPVGTHAHELSMVFMCLFPKLDANEEKIHFSEALAHYMYYRLVHQGFAGPMPMLPDTMGTGAFLKAAELLNVTPMKDGVPQTHQQCTLLEVMNSARQDSGKMDIFKKILEEYPLFKGSMMASEIDSTDALMIAGKEGYATFGAGGFMGDSEKVWKINPDLLEVSMAVKVVRVWVDGKRTEVQPVKLGDGDDDVKATCDTTLSREEQTTILDNAKAIKQAAKDVPHGHTTMMVDEKFDISYEVPRKRKA
jgi:nicotinic acid phosphoribosyltransferase